MSSGRRIILKGFVLDKETGKRVLRDPKALNVSKRLQQRGSTKIRYGKKGK
jgi:hypothetical protein